MSKRRGLILTMLFGMSIVSVCGATISFDPSETTVQAGSSFTLAIYGTPGLSEINGFSLLGAYSLFLDSSATGDQIELQNPVLNTADFYYVGGAPSASQIISASLPSSDLGAFTNASSTLPADGPQYLLSTVTISIAALAAPGYYSIGNTDGTVFTDPSFIESDFAPANFFQIDVVPEPGTLALLGMTGGFGCLWLARRRREASLFSS